MTERHDDQGSTSDRRLTAVFYLTFAVMLTAALAVLPLVADTYRLSGMWITFCAAIGID
ncbi:MAG: hypothetical protein P1U88_08545 [Thalassobaculaceae bacterium]|nr:hypothetical protein [Thalassobaculaceae bacterium]